MPDAATQPDEVPELGSFGQFGGRYVAETLMPAVEELAREWPRAWADPEFRAEYERIPQRDQRNSD